MYLRRDSYNKWTENKGLTNELIEVQTNVVSENNQTLHPRSA